MVRIRLAALVTGAFVMAACHSEPTEPGGREAATDAAQAMLHLADSLSINGGNASEVGAYRGLASLLMDTGRLSSVTITVDDVTSEYLVTAQEIQFDGCPPEMLCTMQGVPSPIRSVVAWEKNNPRRMVQFFASVMPDLFWATGGAQVRPSLMFLDGAGSMYGGNAATQNISVTVSDTPCVQQSVFRTANYPPWPCRQAEFQVAFDGTLTLIPLEQILPDALAGTQPNTNAAPAHHLTMASQQVHGAHADLAGLCIECANPQTTPPMSTPWRDSLTATLTTTVGSDVTFTFTVTNTSAQSATVKFNDAQQYDIRVWDADESLVWRWGADKAFAQALTTRTLAAGESVTFVEYWKPASAGSYHAMAYLTSSSHGAVAFANFSAP